MARTRQKKGGIIIKTKLEVNRQSGKRRGNDRGIGENPGRTRPQSALRSLVRHSPA